MQNRSLLALRSRANSGQLERTPPRLPAAKSRAVALRPADPAHQPRGRRRAGLARRLLLHDRLERHRPGHLDRAREFPDAVRRFRIPARVQNNVIWLAMFLTVPIAMALVAAGLLAPIRHGAIVFRLALFIPYVLPSVITAALWRKLLILTGNTGAVDRSGRAGIRLAFLGIPGPPCRLWGSSTTGTGGAS